MSNRDASQFALERFRDEDTGKLISFTSLGGYPVVYWSNDGDAWCAECSDSAITEDEWDKPTMGDIYYEGAIETCCQCGKEMPSAYGDPAGKESDND